MAANKANNIETYHSALLFRKRKLLPCTERNLLSRGGMLRRERSLVTETRTKILADRGSVCHPSRLLICLSARSRRRNPHKIETSIMGAPGYLWWCMGFPTVDRSNGPLLWWAQNAPGSINQKPQTACTARPATSQPRDQNGLRNSFCSSPLGAPATMYPPVRLSKSVPDGLAGRGAARVHKQCTKDA